MKYQRNGEKYNTLMVRFKQCISVYNVTSGWIFSFRDNFVNIPRCPYNTQIWIKRRSFIIHLNATLVFSSLIDYKISLKHHPYPKLKNHGCIWCHNLILNAELFFYFIVLRKLKLCIILYKTNIFNTLDYSPLFYVILKPMCKINQ